MRSVSYPATVATNKGNYVVESVVPTKTNTYEYKFETNNQMAKMKKMVEKSGDAKSVRVTGMRTMEVEWKRAYTTNLATPVLTSFLGTGIKWGGIIHGIGVAVSAGSLLAFFNPATVGLILLGMAISAIADAKLDGQIKKNAFDQLKDMVPRKDLLNLG